MSEGPLRVRRLDHVSVRVGDLARARHFYEELLGLPIAPRPDLGVPGAWYEVAGQQLHLIAQAKMLDDIDPTDTHFALEVESLAEVKRTLDARDIRYLDFGGSQLWIRDPDGNLVELCEGPRRA
jgi:catechol 2,3-dioxygenase-like lactoylglutathione lyase family enzyme